MKHPAIAGGGMAQRHEWEMPVKAGDLPLPDERSPVPKLLDGQALQPAFDVVARRRLWNVTVDGAQLEVAADEGEVIAGGRRAPFHEIEIELIMGQPAAAFALARRIGTVIPARLGVLAKAERGFRLLGPEIDAEEADEVRLLPDITPVEAFAVIALACLRQYRLNETILLTRRSIEAVHQARVALRRLRSAMVLFRKLLPDEDARVLAARIRALAHALGEVRDYDILTEQAQPGPLREKIETAREAAHEKLRAALADDEARHLLIDLAEWVAIGAWRTDPATAKLRAMPLPDFAEKALDRLHRKVRRHGRHLAALDDEARHQLRRDVKKLRYGIEFLGKIFDSHDQKKRRRKFLKALKRLQEQLGALNDLVTAENRLSALGVMGTSDAEQFLASWHKDKLLQQAADFRHDLLDEKPVWR